MARFFETSGKRVSIQNAWGEYQAENIKTFADEAKEAYEFYVSHGYACSFRWIETLPLKIHMENYFEYLSSFDKDAALQKLSWRCEEVMRHGRIFRYCHETFGTVPVEICDQIWSFGKIKCPEKVIHTYLRIVSKYSIGLESFLDLWSKSRKRIEICEHRLGIIFKAFTNAGLRNQSSTRCWENRYGIKWPSQRVVLNLPRFHNWARGYAAVSMRCNQLHRVWTEKVLILLGRISAPCREYVVTRIANYEPDIIDASYIEDIIMKWQALPLKDRLAPCNMGQRRWTYYTHRNAPDGLKLRDPKFFNFKAFKYLHERFEHEEDEAMNLAAYNISASMQANTARYFEKWGENNVHDAGQLFNGEPLNKSWQDFILKFGPEAAKLSRFSKDILVPPKSLRELRNIAAHIMYPGLDEKLSSACAGVNLTQEEALWYSEELSYHNVKTFESCPDIDITMDGYRFHKLESDDPKGPLLGLYTDCCQHPRGAGAECAWHGYASGYGAFYIVEYKGVIIGQSWAWRGGRKKLLNNPFRPNLFANDSPLNTLCFDNIELLSNVYGPTVLKLYVEAARRMLGSLGIERVTVGLGYNDLQELETLRNDSYHAEPVDYDGYRDSHRQKILYTMLEY